jgi:polysaccharide biosynthesis/export protein
MLKCLCQKITRAAWVLGLVAGWAGLVGCQTQPAKSNSSPDSGGNTTAAAPAVPAPAAPVPTAPEPPATAETNNSMVLREGDTVRIAFPGSPSLDTVQIIRRDGKISLEMVGEMKAAGLTPKELEAQLLKAYGDQLQVKEVTVTVQASIFTVYVTGAVMRPGKLMAERVMTPLEAVIEAGIDPGKSNLKKVTVIRESESGKTEIFNLNLHDVMIGRQTVPFILKSMDKIVVPEKFSFF